MFKDREMSHGKHLSMMLLGVIFSLSLGILSQNIFVYGVTSSPTSLDNSTITYILNQFNPANTPIATTSYVSPTGCQMPQPSSSSGAINKITCGLYASDNLTKTATQQQLQTNSKYWVYGGDAIAEKAPYGFYQDSQGLHIGIQAPSNGTYAGFYAVSPNSNAQLFHAVITSPANTIPYGFFQNGLYVQTAQAPVNYVTCVAITSKVTTIWALVHTYGGPSGSLTFQTLWYDPSPNQSLTRDCTIITNGHNYLKLYMDNALVYSSNTLTLGMPAPFNAFLEPQTSYDKQELFGTYRDFYATTLENVKVKNNPANATTAEIVDTAGNILTSSPIILGNASLDVGRYHMSLNANVKIINKNNNVIASTPVVETIYGGDVYAVFNSTSGTQTPQLPTFSSSNATSIISSINSTIPKVPQVPQVPSIPAVGSTTITITSAYGNGTNLNGAFIELHQGSATIATGFTPVTFNVTIGQTYSITADDYAGQYFNHWNDGSQSRTIQITALAPLSKQAIYTYTPQPSQPPLIGPDTVTVTTSFINGTSDNGEYVQIRQSGNIVGDGFTPITFSSLTPGVQYETVMYSNVNNYMRHYSDGTLTRYHFVTPGLTPITLNAQYENVPAAKAAKLDVTALDSNGNVLGSSRMVNGSVVATPGMYMDLIPSGQTSPYTATFTGAGDLPWVLFNGKTYTVEMTKAYGKYQFDHWQDNNSTNPVRAFTLSGNSTANIAIYKIIS